MACLRREPASWKRKAEGREQQARFDVSRLERGTVSTHGVQAGMPVALVHPSVGHTSNHGRRAWQLAGKGMARRVRFAAVFAGVERLKNKGSYGGEPLFVGRMDGVSTRSALARTPHIESGDWRAGVVSHAHGRSGMSHRLAK